MLNKKIVSVLAVTLMLTMGIGVAFVGNDESEAVWNPEVPLASLTMNAYQLWQAYDGGNGTDTYWVAYGTQVYIDHHTPTWDSDVLVVGVASDYGTGDTAGLTLDTTNDILSGKINKGNSGLIEITVEFRDQGGEQQITISLAVIDLRSSISSQWSNLTIPANIFIEWGQANSDYYVEGGATVNVSPATFTIGSDTYHYYVTGFDTNERLGLQVSDATGIQGTVTGYGTATFHYAVEENGTELSGWDTPISIIAEIPSHADVRMIGGETWTYTPTTNIASVTSISGTATSWVSLTGGTVSGTAPTNTSVGQTYDLTITASTTQPVQTVTQTVTFTVDPQITLTAPASYTVFGTDTSNVLGSNFEDGTRNIYSITGGTATGFTVNAATGVLGWDNPAAGTITFTATSPYTYTSGATNTASATMDVTVTGILTASVSGTLYLVTGKTVPNTPAEAVTLNHNDVGSGTYTWAVVGTNTSGVTVASNGTLGGTPGNVGTYAVTVRCTSVVGGTTQTADTTLNIVIVNVLRFTSSPSQGTIIYTPPAGGTITTVPVEENAYITYIQQGSSRSLMSANSAGSATSDKIGANVTWDLSAVGNVYAAVYSDSSCTNLLTGTNPNKIGDGLTGTSSVHRYASVTGTNPIVRGETYYVRAEAYSGAYGSTLIAVGTPYAVTGD